MSHAKGTAAGSGDAKEKEGKMVKMIRLGPKYLSASAAHLFVDTLALSLDPRMSSGSQMGVHRITGQPWSAASGLQLQGF